MNRTDPRALRGGALELEVWATRPFATPGEEDAAPVAAFVAAARNMQPFPDTDQAELPGNLEWQRERDYIRDGLPIEPGHQQALSDLGAALGVESPFAQYEHQRFGAE